jgi:hypothetical protein
VRESFDEPPEGPEVVSIGVRFDRPRGFEYVREVADVDGGYTFYVQSFDEVARQRVHRVVPAVRSFAVQLPYVVAAVLVFFPFDRRLSFGDVEGRPAEPLEETPTAIEVLLAGTRGTGDDVGRTDVQSSRFVG